MKAVTVLDALTIADFWTSRTQERRQIASMLRGVIPPRHLDHNRSWAPDDGWDADLDREFFEAHDSPETPAGFSRLERTRFSDANDVRQYRNLVASLPMTEDVLLQRMWIALHSLEPDEATWIRTAAELFKLPDCPSWARGRLLFDSRLFGDIEADAETVSATILDTDSLAEALCRLWLIYPDQSDLVLELPELNDGWLEVEIWRGIEPLLPPYVGWLQADYQFWGDVGGPGDISNLDGPALQTTATLLLQSLNADEPPTSLGLHAATARIALDGLVRAGLTAPAARVSRHLAECIEVMADDWHDGADVAIRSAGALHEIAAALDVLSTPRERVVQDLTSGPIGTLVRALPGDAIVGETSHAAIVNQITSLRAELLTVLPTPTTASPHDRGRRRLDEHVRQARSTDEFNDPQLYYAFGLPGESGDEFSVQELVNAATERALEVQALIEKRLFPGFKLDSIAKHLNDLAEKRSVGKDSGDRIARAWPNQTTQRRVASLLRELNYVRNNEAAHRSGKPEDERLAFLLPEFVVSPRAEHRTGLDVFSLLRELAEASHRLRTSAS